MIKSTKMLKRLGATFLVVLMSIESFAAVVGDNDGAAFITKAEFDSMKNDFQSQLDRYNSSIDNKVDGAISAYLAGVRVASIKEKTTLSAGEWEAIDTEFKSGDYTWRYKYGSPRIGMTVSSVGWIYGGGTTDYQKQYGNRLTKPSCVYGTLTAPALTDTNVSTYIQHKLCLSEINETERTAAWFGSAYRATDFVRAQVVSSLWKFSPWLTSSNTAAYFSPFIPGREGPFKYNDWNGRHILNYIWTVDINAKSFSTEEFLDAVGVTQDWGIIHNKNVIVTQNSVPYRNFSKYPEQRNWGFYSPSTDNKSFEKLWSDTTTPNMSIPASWKNAFGTGGDLLVYNVDSTTSPITYDAAFVPLNLADKFSWRNNSTTEGFGTSSARAKYCVWPCLGFEENYITNWNQIYSTTFDNIAQDLDLSDKTAFLKDDNGKYHVALTNGLPLVKIESNNSLVTFDIKLKTTSYDITTGAKTETALTDDAFVWFSDEPFTAWPNDQQCLDFTPLDNTCEKATTANFNKAVKVPAANAQSARVSIIAPSAKKYIWVKWATNGQYGGGTLVVPEKVTVTESG